MLLGAGALFFDPVLADRLLSVFTRIDTSSEMRLAFWESTIAMILDHPFLGIGWGAYFMVYPDYDFYLQGAPVQIVHAVIVSIRDIPEHRGVPFILPAYTIHNVHKSGITDNKATSNWQPSREQSRLPGGRPARGRPLPFDALLRPAQHRAASSPGART